ncbi:Cloroperoxidase [Russula vinacea]|nr:Cloroperoxidase [Russula vinacea]
MSNPHQFLKASPEDSRSPCPALNALANHSILPHNGRNISAFKLISVLREHYNVSLPLAILLSLGGTLKCGRHFKIDLGDLARHNVIEHDASLTHADALPGARYAPVEVDKELVQQMLDASQNPKSDILTFDELVTVRANRDATLRRPFTWAHGVIARGEIALTVQTLGDEEGNIRKQDIKEWFGQERLPLGWTKPATTIGIWITTRISNWVGELLKKKLE